MIDYANTLGNFEKVAVRLDRRTYHHNAIGKEETLKEFRSIF
jgi:hypothetical protein